MHDLRILIIANEPPAFPGKGSAVRLHHLSRALSADFTLDLICLHPEPRDQRRLTWFDRVQFLPYLPEQDSMAATLFKGLPFRQTLETLHSSLASRPAFAEKLNSSHIERLRQCIEAMEYQSGSIFHGFLVETDQLAGVISAIPSHGLAMLDCHSLSSHNLLAEANASQPPQRRALLREVGRIHSYEKEHWHKYEVVTLSSDEDFQFVQSRNVLPSDRLTLIPNGVDLDWFKPLPPDEAAVRTKESLLFVGDFATATNIEAVMYLFREILPAIRRVTPTARVTVVCRNLKESIVKAAAPFDNMVQFVLNPRDIREMYHTHRAFIGPYTSGGGARLTVLEAMASGLPVITTTFGLHGLQVRDGEHLLVADSPAEFVSATGRVGVDEILRQRLAASARRYVETEHPWTRVARKVGDIFLRQHTRV